MASYARVLGIDQEDALAALEDALKGKYDGALWRKYLRPDDSSDGPSFSLYEGEMTPKGEPPGRETKSAAESNVQMGRSTAIESSSRRIPFSGWVGIIFFGAILLIWLFRLLIVGSSNDQSATPIDLVESAIEVVKPEPEWIVMADSMRFDIIAVSEHLDPIRVTVDDDMRRPFWVGHGDTLTFYVSNSIILERELHFADILLNGYLLSDSLIDSDGRMTMTRDRAQTWLDTLAVRLSER